MFKWLKNNKLSAVIGIFVVVMSVMPSSGFGQYALPFTDKIVHIVMYFLFGSALMIDRWQRRQLIDYKLQTIVFVLLFTFVFGLSLEVVQWFLPYRSASGFDILANIVGTVLALVALFIGYRLWGNKPR